MLAGLSPKPQKVRRGDHTVSPKDVEAAALLGDSPEEVNKRVESARSMSDIGLIQAYGINTKIGDLPEHVQDRLLLYHIRADANYTSSEQKKVIAEAKDKTLGKFIEGRGLKDDKNLLPKTVEDIDQRLDNLDLLQTQDLPDVSLKRIRHEMNALLEARKHIAAGDTVKANSVMAEYQKLQDPRGYGDAVRTRNRTSGELEQAGVGGQWDKPTGRGDSSISADEKNMPTIPELESYAQEIGQPNLVVEAGQMPENKRRVYLKSQTQLNPPKELNIINRSTDLKGDEQATARPLTAMNRIVPWSDQADMGPEFGIEQDFDEAINSQMIEAAIRDEDGIVAPDAQDFGKSLKTDRILQERRGEKSPSQIMAENDENDSFIEQKAFFKDTEEDEDLMATGGLPEWLEYQTAKEAGDRPVLTESDLAPLEPDESLGNLTDDEVFAENVTRLKDSLLKNTRLQREVADALALKDFDKQQAERLSGFNRAIINAGRNTEQATDKNAKTALDEAIEKENMEMGLEDISEGTTGIKTGDGRRRLTRSESTGVHAGSDANQAVAQSSRLAANQRTQISNWMEKEREKFDKNIEAGASEFAENWIAQNRNEIESLIAQGKDASALGDRITAEYFQHILDSGDFMGETSPFASLYMRNTLNDQLHIRNMGYPSDAAAVQRNAYRAQLEKQIKDTIDSASKGEFLKSADSVLVENARYEQEKELENAWRHITDLERSIKGNTGNALKRTLSNARIGSMKAEGQYSDLYGEDALAALWSKFKGQELEQKPALDDTAKRQRLDILKSLQQPAKVFFDSIQDAEDFASGVPKAQLLGDNIVSLKRGTLDKAFAEGKLKGGYRAVQKFYDPADADAADIDAEFPDGSFNTMIATVQLSQSTGYNESGSNSESIKTLVQNAKAAGIKGVFYDSKNNTLEFIKPRGTEQSGWTGAIADFIASQGDLLRAGDSGSDPKIRLGSGRAIQNVAERPSASVSRGLRRSGRTPG